MIPKRMKFIKFISRDFIRWYFTGFSSDSKRI